MPSEKHALHNRTSLPSEHQMDYFLERYLFKKSEEHTGCTLQEALKVTGLCEEIRGSQLLRASLKLQQR